MYEHEIFFMEAATKLKSDLIVCSNQPMLKQQTSNFFFSDVVCVLQATEVV